LDKILPEAKDRGLIHTLALIAFEKLSCDELPALMYEVVPLKSNALFATPNRSDVSVAPTFVALLPLPEESPVLLSNWYQATRPSARVTVFRNTEIELLLLFTEIASGFPSPSTSPLMTVRGPTLDV
jgi:hypothetical protein